MKKSLFRNRKTHKKRLYKKRKNNKKVTNKHKHKNYKNIKGGMKPGEKENPSTPQAPTPQASPYTPIQSPSRPRAALKLTRTPSRSPALLLPPAPMMAVDPVKKQFPPIPPMRVAPSKTTSKTNRKIPFKMDGVSYL